MTITRRHALLGIAGTALARPAFAQAWPSRPIRFVVPYGAGNQADLVARVLAEGLGARWGQRPVIENIAGAGGAIGVAQIARAAPDGYTIGLIAIAALAITPHMSQAPYDPLVDLQPLGGVSVSRAALAVNAALPAQDLASFVALAKARRADPLFYYSPGTGTVPHLAAEMLRRALDFPANHVPYRTAAAGVADLVAGRVQFAVDGTTVTLPHVQAGRVRALVAISPTRLALLPGVPSLAEAAPGVELPSAWQALHGPRGFPPEIAARIGADVAALLADPAFVARYPQGSDPLPMTATQAAAQIRVDHARFGALVRELDLKDS
jgi:tripartite-type tricarboxylate transporter receptor subunit TctC